MEEITKLISKESFYRISNILVNLRKESTGRGGSIETFGTILRKLEKED